MFLIIGPIDNFEVLPGDYKGYLKIKRENDERFYTIDEIERIDPEVYENFIKFFLTSNGPNQVSSTRKKKR